MINAAGAEFANARVGNNEKVQVEFVSANPTGPLHAGNGRWAAMGSTLVRVLRAAGYEVEAEYYFNDAGTQIETFGRTLYARYQQAERMKREGMIENNRLYFKPWESIHEASPQEILERREPVTLVPMLIMQGALDDNVLPAVQEKFAATYRAAGGVCELTVFENSEHEWVAKPGPQTDRAREMVKAFIARQLGA